MNPFRQLLRSRGASPPIGTWVMTASPIVAEAIGTAGFDWGVLDMEHTPLDLMELVHLLQAVGNTRMQPVVRVPWNDGVTVKRVLDAGAATLMFPFVQNAEEARRAVASWRYPPEGTRGMAGMSRASRFGTMANYFSAANQMVGVIVQIETPEAVDRIDEIAADEGVDALFVGPGDMSGALGLPGQLTHPQVMATMARAAQRCRDLGMPVGTVGGTTEIVTQYRAMGYDYVAIASDLGLLMRGAQAAINALRTQDSARHVHTPADGTTTAPGEQTTQVGAY
jgi:2-keto-3-deoxy-L-rhamnonate aldolase RhmA